MSSPRWPLSFGELRNKKFAPDNNAIVNEGLLARNAIMVIGGPPKAYKSFVLDTVLVHLATGTNLFGAYRQKHGRAEDALRVRAPQKVLLFEQEIGEFDLQDRLNAVYGSLTAAQQQLVDQNLHTYSCDARLQLDNQTGVAEVAALCAYVKPDVVAFDPLVEFHTSDENSTKDMSLILRNIDFLRQKYDFATLINHHHGKPTAGDVRQGPDLLRGSSVLYGKADSFLTLAVANRNAKRIGITFTIRRGKPIAPMYVLLDDAMRARFMEWEHANSKKHHTVGIDDNTEGGIQ
jgi:RecA-family ATPase